MYFLDMKDAKDREYLNLIIAIINSFVLSKRIELFYSK